MSHSAKPDRSTLALGSPASALLALALVAAPAAAQDVSVSAVAAVDGLETNIQLLSVTVRPGEAAGWYPLASVQSYRLGYDATPENTVVWSLQPAVGAGYRYADGDVYGKLGYSFKNENQAFSVPILEGGSEGGVNTSLHALYWAGPELQGIASYSWASDYLWTQAQAALPVYNLAAGRIGLGAEYTWQGDLQDEDIRAQQVGPLLKWAIDQTVYLSLSAGWKWDESRDDTTWYSSIAATYSP